MLIFPILTLVIILVFWQLPQTFYQQDEWHGLGLALGEGINSVFHGVSSPLDILFVKGRILASFIYFLFASLFPFQNAPIAILAIVLHISATFLVFILIRAVIPRNLLRGYVRESNFSACGIPHSLLRGSLFRKFTQNNLFSFLGATFFAVNAVSHGAVTWPAIAINSVTSTILVLLAILFFFKYLDYPKSKWLILAGLVIYISLWFRETGFYLFLLLPLSALLFKRYRLPAFLKTYWALFLPFLLIVSYRIIELKARTTPANLYITGLNENFFSTIILRSILYPLTSFSLMFVPGDQFLEFARAVLRQIYPFFASSPQNILIAQTAILDLLAVILTLFILVTLILLLQKEKLETKKMVLFWLAFTFMSFLPYVLISKDFSYLEGRYYYLSVVGGAVLLAWVLKRLREVFGLTRFYLIVLPVCIIFLVFHASVVRGAIAEQVRLSIIRKDFVSQLKMLVRTLDNKKNVFYLTGSQNYWADGNKIPFQQGSGFTFMILYNKSGKIPKEFLKDEFLSEIGSQGYREAGEYGFGYFWERQELEKAVKLYKLPSESIISLEYDSQTKKLIPIGNDK